MVGRAEFTKPVKRLALKRSEGKCEAIGLWYGLPDERRCLANLAYGVEFDHIILAANGGRSDLDNCAAVCVKCHKWKTTQRDTPEAAKTVRMQDKHLGIKTRKRAWPKRKFGT